MLHAQNHADYRAHADIGCRMNLFKPFHLRQHKQHGEQRYGVYEKTHEITSLPAENIYKTCLLYTSPSPRDA